MPRHAHADAHDLEALAMHAVWGAEGWMWAGAAQHAALTKCEEAAPMREGGVASRLSPAALRGFGQTTTEQSYRRCRR
jgi:hypothetical protein